MMSDVHVGHADGAPAAGPDAVGGRDAPLTDAQRRQLERRLLEERCRVLRTLGHLELQRREGDAGGGGRMPEHLADLDTDTMQATLDGVLASRESRALAEIDDALRRLYGAPTRFGLDEVTGEPIPFTRLEALPWTRRAAG